MSILFKDYEVSIWNYVDNGETFEESKLAVIGSSDMTALSRCVQPNLTLRANGNNTFSFVLYTRYYDGMEKVDNPFVKLMYNGRRVKVRVEDEWYDFVVTDIQESSDNKSITYSCVDAFNYELGKSGYELEFDEELETQGTTEELAAMILEGTAWSVDSDKCDDILQYKYEQLVEYQETATTQAISLTFTGVLPPHETITIDIPLNESCYFYGFYSQINDEKKQQFILYNEGEKLPNDSPVSLDRLEYTLYYFGTGDQQVTNGHPISIKANRLVDTYDSNIDKIIDKYYTTYTKNTAEGEPPDETEYRIYSEVEYKKPYTLINYIDIGGFMGYKKAIGSDVYSAIAVSENYSPQLTSDTLISTNRIKYYKWDLGDANIGYIYYGINSLKNKINFNDGDNGLIFEIQYLPSSVSGDTFPNISKCEIINYKSSYADTDEYTNAVVMTRPSSWSYKDTSTNTIYYHLTSCKNMTTEQWLNIANLKLSLELNADSNHPFNVVKTRLYNYIRKDTEEERKFYIPEDLLTTDITIEPIVYYYAYDPSQTYTSLDDLQIIEKTTNIDGYTPKSRNFKKIRSISGKQSNRFNLLQTICERFECWLHFSFEREPNGKVISKKIYFTDTQGKKVSYGFISGINLKNSQRTLKSENLVTRLIVSPNANEFAEGGSCNISLSQWNYTGENALYNFDYYISKGAIDRDTWLRDFYYIHSTESGSTETEDDDGWFVKLHNANEQREVLITEITELSTSLAKAKADLDLAQNGMTAADENKRIYDEYIAGRAGAGYDYIVANYNPSAAEDEQPSQFWKSLLTDNKFQFYWLQYEEAQKNYDEYEALFNTTQAIYEALNTAITNDYNNLVILNNIKQAIYDEIYAKYYPFIQEGSWINEDYFDNDLYYVDSETTLYTSAYPEISYSLSVIDLESLEDFKAYKFIPGDISFVQDTDFFGWEDDNITPHTLKVWISEKKINLDDPTNTTITVQNYANDFDSLFQKITAATQTLQYKEGVYNRSGRVINGDGKIEYDAIADTLRLSPISLENLGAQSVDVGEEGITVTSLLQPSHKVRIIGDGIYISDNGGNEYYPVITGAGTNLSKLTAGQIDTTNINIVDGSFNMFRWDENGINAYWYEDTDNIRTYDSHRFVRLDRFGLYGYNGQNDVTIFKPDGEPDIINNDNTLFSLTWSGLNFRSEKGIINFSSTDNQLRIQGEEPSDTIIIGDLGGGKYGIQFGIPQVGEQEGTPHTFSDLSGIVNEHISTQKLWLRYDDETGLILGREGSNTIAHLTNEKFSFDIAGNIDTAYFTPNELYVAKIRIVGEERNNAGAQLSIGEFQFIRTADGWLDLKVGNEGA